ncbi:MAG: hypothetical protein GY715_08745 [Planctomycetes bacterium]|nr:hypothetical protein [Planctomycetota bacterium]
MFRERSRMPVLLGFVVSLVMHTALILPMLMVAMTRPGRVLEMPARFDPEDFRQPPEDTPSPDETPLGIDADTSSTMTWVGAEEYEEHLAKLAEVEQAAFAEAPPAGGMPEQAPAQPVEEQVVEATSPEPEAEPVEPLASPLSEADLVAINDVVDRLRAAPMPKDGDDASGEEEDRRDEPRPIDEALRKLAESLDKAVEAQKQKEQQPAPPSPTGPTPTPSETDGKEPEEEPLPGEPAERDTPATSIIEVPLDQLRLGRPIARKGLELLPKRPRFTTLTLLSASPCNPHVEIEFGANGVPANCTILRTSCDQRIDHGIESSLYRWRAKGKDIQNLAEGETLKVRLTILLNKRARR